MINIDPAGLRLLTREQQERFALLLAEHHKRQAQRLFFTLFPDQDTIQPDGKIIHARAKYAKHLEFFRVGSTYRERCFLAANRVGKTIGSGYELTAHLTGLYPDWWEGRRFDGPIRAWAAGKTNESTRDVLQKETLLGDPAFDGQRKIVSGTRLIPGRLLGPPSWKQGVQDFVDTIKVKHVSGKWSTLGFKSYQQGRGSFEGTAQHVIWLDEECPNDVYGECVIRTATTNGLIMLSFTPLTGLSETVLQFMPKEDRPEGS